ncbi:zinc finger protein 862-like [Mercenaria mercenaria]|uniref:zinc finger protein 862-like n=1 Tax=Mercenaria mercenaria TaxID=6596 RepID=UPI00234F5964|nr:zinc finger protein 862-like [Mercenaria mercenaria]
MYCRLCQKHKTKGLNGSEVWSQIGCRSLRLDKVTTHENSDQHQSAVKLETESQLSIEQSFSDRTPLNEKEFEAVVCATKVVHFLVKHNIPHTTVYEEFIKFAVEELKSPILANLSRSKNAKYTSQTTADELLSAMSQDIEETLRKRVTSSPAYSVMTDEATDIANRKHLAFCVKYVDSETGDVNVDFIKDVQVDDGKAETIFSETKVLVEEDLKFESFVGFGSDGCNTMVGKKSGVSTRLKEIKPDLITVHCHNHRLALAAKNSFESIKEFRDTDEVLSGVYKYYKSSGNRTRSLEKLQNILDESDTKRIKQVAHTRWLSHLDAVTSLRDTYPAVLMDLENCEQSGNDRVRIGSGPSASGLSKKLKCYQTVHIIHFLCDALRPVTQLALTFEKNSVDLSVIKPRMDAAVSTLRKLQTSDGISLKKAEKLMTDFNITPTEEQMNHVKQAEHKFIDNLIDNIEMRLENIDIIDSMAVFTMQNTECFAGNDEIEILAHHFGLDIDQCLLEWDQLKNVVRDIDNGNIDCPSSLVKTISSLKNTAGDIFPSIEKMCAAAAVLPLSTAEVERVFSDVNRTVTDIRNRLKVETTNKLLLVHKGDKYLDFERTVRLWHKQKPRRINI